MSLDPTTIIVSVVTAGATLGVAKAARRSPRQEKRDDFAAVTDRMDKEFARMDGRLSRQDATISGQGSAITYLSGLVRSLVIFTRAAGLEPPAAAPPPEDAAPFLHDIGV